MKYFLIILVMLCSISLSAQNARKQIRQGNKYVAQGLYDRAAEQYRKAISKERENAVAHYNLGCVLLAQKQDTAAIKEFEVAAKLFSAKKRKAMAYHNMGVILQQRKMTAQAIEAYKESLRNNPDDDETRYNLALCKKQQKESKQQKQQDKKQQQKKQQQKQRDEEDKRDSENKQQPQMSKDNVDQLLNAAMQQEQATQEKMKKALRQPRKKNLIKNW